MKHRIQKALKFMAILLAVSGTVNAQKNDWENPGIVDQHKEPSHPTFMLYNNEQDAIADDYSRSGLVQSPLNECPPQNPYLIYNLS